MEHQDLVEPLKQKVLPVLGKSLKDWLNRGKIRLDKESAIKFKALNFSAKSKCLTQDNLDFFTRRLFELVPKWKGQVQGEALNVLNSISSLANYAVGLKVRTARHLGPIIYFMKADLCQDINGGFAYSRCLNGTFS